MFKREHHKRIASILQALNADLLDQHQCLFGGGTAIVLARDEYRESVDIDFLVSDSSGYRDLRQLLVSKGIAAIARPGMQIVSMREVRADQYGVRTMLQADDIEIKFEIVFESRIELETSGKNSKICGVSTLTSLDMATTKLLANSDRWSDSSVYSRDVIDLAMVGLPKDELALAKSKAAEVYGESIQRDLEKAIDFLAMRKGRLEQCMDALKIDTVPKALLWKKIKNLRD
ncbi:nucleotidyl transferase AbiEii/AbiGii toxin family protein [Bdellovibrio bacteriovorus]|uniref:nucleotidyl transferase AbiEii/AbiGii toxin family protein n=1 Tax=Bdellovibrio bacteriovorus TaxID=959 RepID=UPI0035A5D614